MSSSYRLELDRWLSNLDVKADRVLDIGGAQLPVKGRTKSWDVKEYLIADLPNPHKDSPKPDLEFDMNIGYPIGWYHDNRADSGFDLIFCLEVFDYIYNPTIAFLNLSYSLRYGGEAFVSFPSFYPLHQPIDDDALRYMPGGIKKLADFGNLVIKEWIPRRAETNKLQEFFSAERMRAAKGEEHNITGWIVRFSK